MLRAQGLHYAYDGSPALQDVSLSVAEGEIVSIRGPRGSGKTTLLSCLSGQLPAPRGEVWFDDIAVHTLGHASRQRLRRDRFGWIGSTPQLVPELTAWENAALPLLLNGTGHRAAQHTAREWLDRLDIGDCARKRPASLLQSQRQRVAIARALAGSPAVLFADEPTAPLHRSDRAQVLRTLTTAARSHAITVVLATHDLVPQPQSGAHDETGQEPAEPALTDRTITLLDGQVHHQDPPPRRSGNGPAGGRDAQGRDTCSLSV
nr:ATP-binding cassette domain-containing protein [Streptomyces sp. HNM0574]